ncbi:MAG: DNA polymerase III subunit gamma/tau [Ignavibacteriaceae bacterium]
MAFIVTARKWRPQRFVDVVGQEHISATLKNAIKNNRIAHAYLFTGPRGVGKTTTARIFAKSLNCLNQKDAEPCNECEMCKAISTTQSMDIIEIDGASNRGIDEIRTLRESVKYAPSKGKYKIYIIDEVHMLTKESFNAFLKTLEEPPAHTIFIFATTDIHKVPLTIISRCQRFDFRRIQLDTIKSTLANIAKSENIEIDDKTLTIIAKKADGALRDAESFFDQVVSFCGSPSDGKAGKIDAETVARMLNLVDDEIYFRISDAVLEKNFKAVFEVTNIIYENGWDFIDFTNGLIEHFRNIMTVILTQRTELVETADIYRTRYLDYIDKFSEGDILRLLNFLNKTQQELRYAQNHKLKIEISLSHLIGLEKTSTITDLLSQVQNLPEKTLPSADSTYSGSLHNGSAEIKEPPKPRFSIPKPISSKSESAVKKANDKAGPVITESNWGSSKNVSLPSKEIVAAEGVFNIDSIIKRWSGFVESVSSEKGLILGPFIQNARPVALDGTKLNLQSNVADGKVILAQQQEYITKKALDFFGKKLTFHLTGEGFIEEPPAANEPQDEKLPSIKEKEKIDDPFTNYIINEMGGEEI